MITINNKEYKLGSSLSYKKLERDMLVMVSYGSGSYWNPTIDFKVKVNHFSISENGEHKGQFRNWKVVTEYFGKGTTMKSLAAAGYDVRVNVTEVDESKEHTGDFLYEFQNRLCVGSGAQKCSFTQLITAEEYEADKVAKEKKQETEMKKNKIARLKKLVEQYENEIKELEDTL